MTRLDLADWRERVARLYLSDADLDSFRAERDLLFATHPESPLPAGSRGRLRYFPFNPDAVIDAEVEPASGYLDVDTGGPDGVIRYSRVGIARTPFGPLTLWWIEAYGGGLFLPVRDGTSGQETYGGGRYLTDTVKGTHGRAVIRTGKSRLRLDFNYAYNPSCAYSSEWACPLAPPENRVSAPIHAGEMTYLTDPP